MRKNIFVEVEDFTFRVVRADSPSHRLPILLLHGFTGNANDLFFLSEFLCNDFPVIAPDLPGHGKSFPIENPDDYKIETIARRLNMLLEILGFNKAIIIGYSMGGRIAYTFAARYPEKVTALLIESSTPGIKNEDEREARRNSDKKLAEMILSKGVRAFTDYWLSLPLFGTLQNIDLRLLEKLRIEKNKNHPIGLANSLLFTGTGNMQPVWDKLKNFNFSSLLINGTADKKYSEINKKASKLLPDCKLSEIPDAGHNTHFEKPDEFIAVVKSFIAHNKNSFLR